MSTIIAHPSPEAHPDRDADARHRAARLAKATTDQMQAALAYLSMIDPEAFEIAFTAVATGPVEDESEEDEPVPLCATCGAPIGIFPEVILDWRHFRGALTDSGVNQTFDTGHAPDAAWYLPDEDPAEL
jgi:hypothetical protein